MPTDEFVRLGKHLCFICLHEMDSGEILIHRRLQRIPDDQTITGISTKPCPTCQERLDGTNGPRVALVEADIAKSAGAEMSDGRFDPRKVYRTGRIMFIPRHVFSKIFDMPVPDVMTFVDPPVIDMLQRNFGNMVVDLGSR